MDGLTGRTARAERHRMDCHVDRKLGDGGQGTVYVVRLGGSELALKWYHPHTATPEQRATLEYLVDQHRAPTKSFLWPIDIVSMQGIPGFGYIMGLREPRFKSLNAWMRRARDVKPTFRSLMTAGMELADSFLKLHSRGLCYRDINLGNIFFDPKTGDVQICDNDNVGVDGQGEYGVVGTLGFMAPELVRREAKATRDTDLFSLAVLLFHMFVLHHPFHGKMEAAIHSFDLPAKEKLYGYDPVFIYDPADRRNEPDPNYDGHTNAIAFWRLYPEALRRLFVKSFTAGIRDTKHGRVQEGVWRQTLVRLRDSIYLCSRCGSENFHDPEALQASGGAPPVCTNRKCGSPLVMPPRIRFTGDTVVMLNSDTTLFPHHTDPGKQYEFTPAVAQVTKNPQNPSQWGLKNLTSDSWTGIMPDGRTVPVPPGRSFPLVSGARINFGRCEGEIRAPGATAAQT